MTLTREQVIAWVESQVASCGMVGPKGLHISHQAVQVDADFYRAILTLLQSAETVAQERDQLRSLLEASTREGVIAHSLNENVRLEAEVTRLRGMWEALKVYAKMTNGLSDIASEFVLAKMAELEATPSGPAEEGR